MAKKPEQRFDEEAILRLRDGITNSEQPLAPEALRALADARLRALAFALKPKQEPSEAPSMVDDTRLVAYLLDLLLPDQRHELEQAIIGDRQAFSRLAELRVAFDRPTDKRDRNHADL